MWVGAGYWWLVKYASNVAPTPGRDWFLLHFFLFSACSVSHTTSRQREAAALGISSRVNCIINPQAVKRQTWLEFTLEPLLSHRHNLALSDTTLLISPQRYLRENAISQILAHSCIQGISSSLMRVFVFGASFFHFLSHVCGLFFVFWRGAGQL